MRTELLLVDDDQTTIDLLSIYFGKEGYHVTTAMNGIEGLDKLDKSSFDLILLDVMMPKMDGHKFLEKIRLTSDVPVIFLTARDSQMDKNQGFLLGCDDYMVKPYDLSELKLRVQALLRRSQRTTKTNGVSIHYKDLTIDVTAHEVTKNQEILNVTSKEFDIMKLLFTNPGRVFSAQEIYERVWEDSFIANDRSVLTHIGNIRLKLGDSKQQSMYIKTIWGVGYKVEKTN